MSQLQGVALVGDVGGTNARLSLVNLADGTLSNTKIYSSVENESLEKVIVKYRQEVNAQFDHAYIDFLIKYFIKEEYRTEALNFVLAEENNYNGN